MNAEAVRQYLRANLFDGDESGVVTQSISSLLDDLVELFMGLQVGQRRPPTSPEVD